MIYTKANAPVLPLLDTVTGPCLILHQLEQQFYQNGNLGEQISKGFAGVFGARIDEDKLELACDSAQSLIMQSYLFPEYADQIVAQCPKGPVRVYYLGEQGGQTANTPNQALLAVKRLWASRWEFDTVLERHEQGQLAPKDAVTIIEAMQ